MLEIGIGIRVGIISGVQAGAEVGAAASLGTVTVGSVLREPRGRCASALPGCICRLARHA